MANWSISEGDFCFVEIPASDQDAAQRFYGSVFDWKFDPMPDMGFTMIKTSEDGVLGGFGRLFKEAKGPLVSIMVRGDMSETLAKVKAAGGEVVVGETVIEGMGSAALIKDPDGNLIGLSRDPD